MDDPAQNEWPQYVELVGLHKFYFEHLIKSAGFGLGIQGAFIAFAAREKLAGLRLQVALAIPLLLGLGATLIFVLSLAKTLDLKRQVHALQQRLGIAWRPHVEVLVWISWVFAVLFGCTTIGLLLLILFPELAWKG
jgi:hypothetical protein